MTKRMDGRSQEFVDAEIGGDERKRRALSQELLAKNTRETLISTYGYGDEPRFRQQFYDCVYAIVLRHGTKAANCVLDCVKAARNAQHPDRCFTKFFREEAVKRGWWGMAQDDVRQGNLFN